MRLNPHPSLEKHMYSTHEGYNDSIHGYYLEELEVGMSASHAKTVTETDVVMFLSLIHI